MSELQKGWIPIKLGEVAELKYGKALPAASRDGGEFPVYGSNGIVGHHSTWLTPAPTIVVGRKGSVGEVCFSDKNCSPIDTTYYIDSFDFFEPKFCFYLLKTLRLGDLNKSTAIPGLNRQDAYDLEISLPPLAEQTRIAAKLDELLAQVGTLKARIDGIPALLKRFRQSALAAAVSGRLTEEWRASSPVSDSAEEYLARVIQNRRQKPVVKFKEPVSPDLEKREIEVPQGWIVASVSSFAECLDSMRVPVKKELRKSGEGKYPYFGANGEVDRVDEYIFDDDLVLVTEDETFYGREKPIAYKYSGKCWVNNHVHALRAHDSVARDYLCYALMHYDVIPWLTGTTGRAKLTQGALLSLPIQVPPPAEQTEIVRRVEQLFAFADQLEAKVNEARTRIDRLTQSILAKAFRGELVPQDPNDEPASVLLERIKAQRAAAPKAKRGRKASA
ncbi:type I restriction endonuclease subunit S [Stutzerimonas balearica]|uniref:restriction endonuclease subunit S n=1 Tax=Stutzerimonas balearica TaxID=74829 RepID=UPI0013F45572|nr:restriction endonuclease subunit S [Stutzerimonas balearica]QII99289.1 type I restriction endonuclease subunit S [Stutzerimonas balearica]